MKVIAVGWAKTGTKSLNAALSELGYEVYDFLEHFWYHGKEWEKIYDGNGSVDTFKNMYENVDVVMDTPIFLFWEEIFWAFPEAKIILTIRDEDSWFKSFQNQIDQSNKSRTGPLGFLSLLFVPIARRLTRHFTRLGLFAQGYEYISAWHPLRLNEMIARQKYRQHNTYVQLKVPKDQLLIFNVKDGWEPLCSFLGKDIPDKKFPHKNIGAKDINPKDQNHPVGKQIVKEFVLFIIGCVGVVGLGIYFTSKEQIFSAVNKVLSAFGFL